MRKFYMGIGSFSTLRHPIALPHLTTSALELSYGLIKLHRLSYYELNILPLPTRFSHSEICSEIKKTVFYILIISDLGKFRPWLSVPDFLLSYCNYSVSSFCLVIGTTTTTTNNNTTAPPPSCFFLHILSCLRWDEWMVQFTV